MEYYGVRLWKTWTVEDEPPGAAEESVILVKAKTEDEAIKLAIESTEKVSSFDNSDGDTVNIVFVGVGSVFETHEEEIFSGIEIFSRLYNLDKEDRINPEWPEVKTSSAWNQSSSGVPPADRTHFQAAMFVTVVDSVCACSHSIGLI